MLLPTYDAVRRRDAAPFPFAPSKILCVGTNYRAHAAEMGKTPGDEPLLFFKPPSSLAAPEQAIVLPSGYQRIDFEGELGVIIGRRARNVARADALDYVLGCVCVNDVSNRDLQKRDHQWARAKGFDTFCPVGPRIVSGLDPSALRVVTRVNGEVRQDGSTSDMVFDVPAILEVITRVMTLEPGDLVSTGTPSGVGPLEPGDRVEVAIDGIGVLANPVVAEP